MAGEAAVGDKGVVTLDKAMNDLQGLWMFEKGEQNGSGIWSLPEEGLYIERNVIRCTKRNGQLIFNGARLEFSIDPTRKPATMDLVRKNGSPGQRIPAIYKIEGDRLYLATDTTDRERRPGQFSVKLTAGQERATNLQIYRLVKPAVADKPRSKKLTEEERDAVNAEALKKLQGHWVFEKSERNGHPYWVLPEESIYIEKNVLQHVRKNGDLIFNGDRLEFTVDATRTPIAIDLVRKNGSPGQKILGIYKIEGNRLVIATNPDMNHDTRPAQFNVRLSAGLERATIIQTYKRAPRQ